MNFYTKSANRITLVIDSNLITIASTHPMYQKICSELKANPINWDKVEELSNIKAALLNYIGDRFKIEDNKFSFNWRGEWKELHNVLVDKILKGWTEGRDNTAYIKFLDNLTKNPLKSAIDELYLFLEANELPITDDGYFLSYKRVTSDFKDYHTGTFDNSVGKIVSMPRKDVEYNRNITCSRGLHFCSKEYLNTFGKSSDPIIVVKIHPKDVVSIPSDYNNAKGRCCRYEVIGVLKNESQPLNDFVSGKPIKTRKVTKKILQNRTDKNLEVKEESIDSNLKVYNTVAEARKFHKPRVINDKFYIHNQKSDEYRLYQFIDGTSNSNLKCIKTIKPC